MFLLFVFGLIVGSTVFVVSVVADSKKGLSCLETWGCGWHTQIWLGATLGLALAARFLPATRAATFLIGVGVAEVGLGLGLWASAAGDGDGLGGLWVIFIVLPVTFLVAVPIGTFRRPVDR